MSYYKFNNSRSNKVPFFVYLGEGRDVTGVLWHMDNSQGHLIPITKEEFEAVQKSYNENEPEMGDEVVVLEYTSVKDRYSTVERITDHSTTDMKGNVINYSLAKLANGQTYNLREIRKINFIHKQ